VIRKTVWWVSPASWSSALTFLVLSSIDLLLCVTDWTLTGLSAMVKLKLHPMIETIALGPVEPEAVATAG
jgi:hypothetical protein